MVGPQGMPHEEQHHHDGGDDDEHVRSTATCNHAPTINKTATGGQSTVVGTHGGQTVLVRCFREEDEGKYHCWEPWTDAVICEKEKAREVEGRKGWIRTRIAVGDEGSVALISGRFFFIRPPPRDDNDGLQVLHFQPTQWPSCLAPLGPGNFVVGFHTGHFFSSATKRSVHISVSPLVACAMFSGSEQLVLCCTHDGKVMLLDCTFLAAIDPEFLEWTPAKGKFVSRTTRVNPRLCAQVLSSGAVATHMAVRSNGMFAVSCSDGRVVLGAVDMVQGDLELSLWDQTFATHFGAATSVCFSGGEGSLLAFCGEDDLVSIVCLKEKRLCFRLDGHHAFVNGVSFRSVGVGEEEENILLVSVAEDLRMIFWRLPPRSQWTKTTEWCKPWTSVTLPFVASQVIWRPGTDDILVADDTRGTLLGWKRGDDI